MRAAIQGVLDEQVIPRVQNRQQAGGDGCHAAGGDQRRFRAFQIRDFGMQAGVIGGVAEADISEVVVVCTRLRFEG